MSRTLVKTDSRGWYVDAADPEAGKTRKQEGDQIFDNIVEAQSALAVLQKANPTSANGNEAKEKPEPPKTIAETGKTLVGKTLTIRCAWKEKGKRCTNERTIKPQDRFQVKFCVEHQKAHRRKLRSEKQRARTAARRAEREAAKAKAAK